jgi:hypothetical protein
MLCSALLCCVEISLIPPRPHNCPVIMKVLLSVSLDVSNARRNLLPSIVLVIAVKAFVHILFGFGAGVVSGKGQLVRGRLVLETGLHQRTVSGDNRHF